MADTTIHMDVSVVDDKIVCQGTGEDGSSFVLKLTPAQAAHISLLLAKAARSAGYKVCR